MLGSVTWLDQPDVEKSRTNKLCAVCYNPADYCCSKCHATLYCNEVCQRRHWSTHKPHCANDPLYTLARPLSMPLYRDFNKAEIEEKHLAFTLQTGKCLGHHTDIRDAHCKLITPTDCRFVEFVAIMNKKDIEERITREKAALMDWKQMGTELVTGFSGEDSMVYRLLFDDNFQNRSDLEENFIAHILVNSSKATRGKFVVIKTPMSPEDNLIPFTKAELVDMITWRIFCGHHQMVSSRIFRENMRRMEMQAYLANMGFKTLNLN